MNYLSLISDAQKSEYAKPDLSLVTIDAVDTEKKPVNCVVEYPESWMKVIAKFNGSAVGSRLLLSCFVDQELPGEINRNWRVSASEKQIKPKDVVQWCSNLGLRVCCVVPFSGLSQDEVDNPALPVDRLDPDSWRRLFSWLDADEDFARFSVDFYRVFSMKLSWQFFERMLFVIDKIDAGADSSNAGIFSCLANISEMDAGRFHAQIVQAVASLNTHELCLRAKLVLYYLMQAGNGILFDQIASMLPAALSDELKDLRRRDEADRVALDVVDSWFTGKGIDSGLDVYGVNVGELIKYDIYQEVLQDFMDDFLVGGK